MRAGAPLALLAALFWLLTTCRNPSAKEGAESSFGCAPRPGGPAPVVTGTVKDASSGKPLAGVRVQGPGGVEVLTDAQGRFVLRGLAPGAEGELVATGAGGLVGRNRLRPLEPGPLEVVIYLRSP